MSRHKDSTEPGMNRRKFCGRMLVSSAGAVLISQGVDVLAAEQHSNLVMYPPKKIEGAKRLMPGSFLYFNYPRHEDQAVLVRNADGEYIAFSRKCAHLGCSIEFDPMRRCLACPCHRGIYDSRTGYVLYGPPPRPLDQVVLQVRAGGEVWAVGKTVGTNDDRA